MRAPDFIVLAAMSRPVTHTYLDGDDRVRECVVDAGRIDFRSLDEWPGVGVPVDGFRWRAFTALGLSLIFLWEVRKP